jgi:hypothetical protein
MSAITKSNSVDCIGDPDEAEGEVGTLVTQRQTQTGDAEALARRPADKHVRRLDLAGDDALGQQRHVAKVRNVRVVMREDGGRKRLDLGEPCGLPAQWLPSNRGRLDPAAHAAVAHHFPPIG